MPRHRKWEGTGSCLGAAARVRDLHLSPRGAPFLLTGAVKHSPASIKGLFPSCLLCTAASSLTLKLYQDRTVHSLG